MASRALTPVAVTLHGIPDAEVARSPTRSRSGGVNEKVSAPRSPLPPPGHPRMPEDADAGVSPPPPREPPLAGTSRAANEAELDALLARSYELVRAGNEALGAESAEEQAVLRLLRRFPVEDGAASSPEEAPSVEERRPPGQGVFGQNFLLASFAGGRTAGGQSPDDRTLPAQGAGSEGAPSGVGGAPSASGDARSSHVSAAPSDPEPAATPSAAQALAALSGLDLEAREAALRKDPAFLRLLENPEALRSAALRAAALDPEILLADPAAHALREQRAAEARAPAGGWRPDRIRVEDVRFGHCAFFPFPLDVRRYIFSSVALADGLAYVALNHRERIDWNLVLVFSIPSLAFLRAFYCPVAVTTLCTECSALRSQGSLESARNMRKVGGAGSGEGEGPTVQGTPAAQESYDICDACDVCDAPGTFFAVGCENGEFLLYSLSEGRKIRTAGIFDLEEKGIPLYGYSYRLGARSVEKQPLLALRLSGAGDLLRSRVLAYCVFKSGAAGFYAFRLAPGGLRSSFASHASPVADLVYIPLPQVLLDVSFDSLLRRNVLVARTGGPTRAPDPAQGTREPVFTAITGTLGGTVILYSLPASPALSTCREASDLLPLLPGAYSVERVQPAAALLDGYLAAQRSGRSGEAQPDVPRPSMPSKLDPLLAFSAPVTAVTSFASSAHTFVLAASADGELGLWELAEGGSSQPLVREFLLGNVSTPSSTLCCFTDAGHSPIVQFARAGEAMYALHSDGSVSRISMGSGAGTGNSPGPIASPAEGSEPSPVKGGARALGRREGWKVSLSVEIVHQGVVDASSSLFLAVDVESSPEGFPGEVGARGAARDSSAETSAFSVPAAAAAPGIAKGSNARAPEPASGRKCFVFLRSGQLVMFTEV